MFRISHACFFLCVTQAGQERFHALGPIYYRDSHAAILVYDITDEDSFTKVQNWVKELRRVLGDRVTLAIVGNKVDLESDRKVPVRQAEEWVAEPKCCNEKCSTKVHLNANNFHTYLHFFPEKRPRPIPLFSTYFVYFDNFWQMIRSALRVPSLAAQKMMKKHPYRFQVFSHCGRHTPPDVGQDGPRRRGAVPPGDAPLTAGHPAAGRRGESRPSRTGPRRRPCCRRRRRPRTREDMLRALGFVCVCVRARLCPVYIQSIVVPKSFRQHGLLGTGWWVCTRRDGF